MSRISLLLNWVLVGVIVSLQATSEAKRTKSSPMTFIPSNNSSMLQVSNNISITVYQKKDTAITVVANATFPKTNTTTVSGSDNCTFGADCSLTIVFTDPVPLTLVLIMKYDKTHISGYWEWSSLTIDGTIDTQTIDPSGNGNMIVTPRQGYTKTRKADINCQRDFTICAPLTLSWTCDGEEFKSNQTKPTFVGIKFPGLQLQPFFGELTKTQKLRFGSNWDCDPLISSALWVSLLIGLGLIIAFYWAVDMISSLHTPDKFDDPKGKPIMVPTTD